jgi:hypothetical protein
MNVPHSKLRRDALRLENETFSDLEPLIVSAFQLYSKIHKIAAPYNSRQLDNDIYVPPSREMFRLKRNLGFFESALYTKMVTATIQFYEEHHGKKQLPEPHPSVIHSIQFSKNDFIVTPIGKSSELDLKLNKRVDGKTNISKIEILNHGNLKPIYVENINGSDFGYLILRPKLGKTGVPVVKFWEALIFPLSQKSNYLIDHIDSNINPRYSGLV